MMELKPCPFCGGIGSVTSSAYHKDLVYGCHKCDVWLWSAEAWNRRATDENAAYERAAMACTDVLTLSTFNEDTVEAAMDCAAAIRALKK